jgi:sugar lactone lactonase YvrE
MRGQPRVTYREIEVNVAVRCDNLLGESPVWSVREQSLYWVDIRAPALFRLNPGDGKVDRWPMPELVGAVVLRQSGGVVVGLQSGLDAFDPVTHVFHRLFAFSGGHADDRTNDARCDRSGRLWFTRMRDFGKADTGGLFRLESAEHALELISGVSVPNAICFSPTGDRFYFADTRKDSLDCFALIEGEGSATRAMNIIPPGLVPGRPDGATVDSDGYVWNARYGGCCVVRSAPDGLEHVVYRLPVSCPTSCSFGGERLDRLFITTARQGLDDAQLSAEPLAGALLAIDPGIRGLEEEAFAGWS